MENYNTMHSPIHPVVLIIVKVGGVGPRTPTKGALQQAPLEPVPRLQRRPILQLSGSL
jgi:hypothetical protein